MSHTFHFRSVDLVPHLPHPSGCTPCVTLASHHLLACSPPYAAVHPDQVWALKPFQKFQRQENPRHCEVSHRLYIHMICVASKITAAKVGFG